MKIAVASIDGVTLAQHLGKAKGFIICEVEGKEIKSSEWREAEQEGYCPCSPLYPKGVCSDCEILLSGGMSPRAAQSMIDQGLKPVTVVVEGDAKDILSRYLKGEFQELPKFCRYE